MGLTLLIHRLTAPFNPFYYGREPLGFIVDVGVFIGIWIILELVIKKIINIETKIKLKDY